MDGPRVLRASELPALLALLDTVFASGRNGFMQTCFERYFAPDNLADHFVFTDVSGVAAHTGMLRHWVSLGGCAVRVGCVGAVGTRDDCRGRGLATQLMDMLCEQARGGGLHFLLISGHRGLYRRLGAAEAGRDTTAELNREKAAALARAGLMLEPMREADLGACARAYARKAAHFLRPPADWQILLRRRRAMCAEVDLFILRRDHRFRGYVIVNAQPDKDFLDIIEHAGCADAIAEAVPLLLRRYGAHTLKIRLQEDDVVLHGRLSACGAEMDRTHTGGTLLLLRFADLMDRLRPYFETRIGPEAAARLVFREEDGTFFFLDGETEIRTDRAGAAALVFGTLDAPEPPGKFAALFPVPALWYGANHL
jgi:predicted N-acetyltransferase YhbS